MKKSTLLTTLALVSTSVIVLAGCTSTNKTTEPVVPTTNPAVVDEVSPAMTGTPAPAEPTISSSTKTNDMKKELDDTKIGTEDFSDL